MFYRSELNEELSVPRGTLIDPACCHCRSNVQHRAIWSCQINEADIAGLQLALRHLGRNGSQFTATGQLPLRHFKGDLKAVKHEPNQRSRQQRRPLAGKIAGWAMPHWAPALSIRDRSASGAVDVCPIDASRRCSRW